MPIVTRWRRLPVTVQWATLCALLLVIVAGLVVALVSLSQSTAAGHQAKSAVQCVNRTLGDRNGTSARDAQAHIDDAKALSKLLASLRSADEASRLAAFQAYQREHDRYVQILTADQEFRASHPLGQC